MARFFLIVLVMIAGLMAIPALAATQYFKAWLADVRVEAKQRGISDKIIQSALPEDMQLLQRVIELDNKQPDKTVKYDDYIGRIVNKTRVETGRAKAGHYRTLLQNVSATYGVDPEMIVALWGLETNYGQNSGSFDVVQALATLAYDGRRSEYFRGELFKALQILEEGHILHHRMKGSWAGAMGQSQFMPSSFFNFAEDFNRDGRRDIWTTEADVFASAAKYLSKNGWKQGKIWGHEVRLPDGFDHSLIGTQIERSVSFWQDKGLAMKDGSKIKSDDVAELASVIQPGGPGTRAFLIYDNYKAILSWNKSHYFATSAGLLADQIKAQSFHKKETVPASNYVINDDNS